ncbi:unnamed protein product [Psylliodes chrysocephalus]|uniref:Uncharacterized protein n=1 Tax=Psylliodes chrysocephalus TaxID=3402493 RepID=A0A9P0G809_9CUCU|nr:unnamed protein product [Psylliodes chrysocephala]
MSSSTAFLIIFLTAISTTRAVVTNEDIRIAILQIVNVVRSTDDKLERHEYRDRVVGEQLKKGMINIDKRIKMLDPLKGTVGRLDERLAAVETILMQKNEREKMQLQRTYEAVIDIQKNLPVIMEELKNDIIAKLTAHEPPAQIIEPVISKKDFEKMEKEVVAKIDKVTSSINKLESELGKIKNDNKQLRDLNNKSSDNLEKLKRHISDNQQLLTKYDKKLSEYNNKIPEISKTSSKEQDEWKQNVLKALDGQKSNVKEILLDLKNLHNKVTQLPQKDDISASQRQNPQPLEQIRRDINDINIHLNSTHDDAMKNLNGLTEISAILVKSIANANNVLDSQRRDINQVLQNVQSIPDRMNQLPQKDDLSVVQRATLKKLDELANSIQSNQQNPATDEIRRTLNDMNNNINKWHADTKNMSLHAVPSSQPPEIREILSDVRNLQNQVNQLPQKYDLAAAQNVTLDKLVEINREITGRTEPVLDQLRTTLTDVSENVKKMNDDTVRNLNDLSEITRSLAESFAKNYGKMRTDIQALSKIDQVMIKTADDVIDTKRRVEYGVHQILGELGKQLKESTKNINQGVSDRFDIFEASILDEETGALVNLTSKIGEDIHQVWRQIGIMYQQISTSADTLNHLQNMTDTYVNGSLGAMDSMKGKVGQITGRMTEVDENLNYLLGRLSLVTQEFNQIKTGLSSALDQIRDSFHEVQDKIKDKGPGPHQISSNEVQPTT